MPVEGIETHRGAALHEVGDPTNYVIIESTAYRVEAQQEVAWVLPRGRQQPTAQFGERESSRVVLTPAAESAFAPEVWEVVRAMYTAQRERGAVFLLRPGSVSEAYYVTIATLGREDASTLARVAIEFEEIYYDPEAA